MMMLEMAQRNLLGSTVANVATTNRAGEKQAVLFLEDLNGRYIRVLVPMAEIEEALSAVSPTPRKPMGRAGIESLVRAG